MYYLALSFFHILRAYFFLMYVDMRVEHMLAPSSLFSSLSQLCNFVAHSRADENMHALYEKTILINLSLFLASMFFMLTDKKVPTSRSL
jgi:hypothetical protein